jgi:ribosomal protein S1
MTNKKIILQDQQKLIPSTIEYQDNINLFSTSSNDLVKGTILLITKSDIFLDFGTKPIIKVSKKLYIKNLVQLYLILNTSYLLVKKPAGSQSLSEKSLKDWIKIKLNEGQSINLKLNTIDSIKNIYTIDFKKTLNYIKYNKFFSELEMIRKSNSSVKGFIINSIKGGFSVALGGLIAFLPAKELMKFPNQKLSETFVNLSMEFKISKISVNNKNIVLTKA